MEESKIDELIGKLLEITEESLKNPDKGKEEIIKFFNVTKKNKELLVEVINQIDRLATDIILNSDIYAKQAKRYNQKIEIYEQAGFSRKEAIKLITKPVVLNLNIK